MKDLLIEFFDEGTKIFEQGPNPFEDEKADDFVSRVDRDHDTLAKVDGDDRQLTVRITFGGHIAWEGEEAPFREDAYLALTVMSQAYYTELKHLDNETPPANMP